ncbi:hypothetical protein GYMLUDRAFT_170207 [Collybiopsis luxurians FD-317 M1]|uniref:Enoyl reductase (ER) domain-containing protein n=1 Tax=Collybiopsis luxurians FD-317 M1 TaxID=944289 RepID=A0A0D0CKT7_9AGAR|nr:hypothetical protein GYMLUDRAFT_170207 [Collybiopsis luxurians FD-317 M1]
MSTQKVLYLEKAKGPFVVSDAPILKPGPGQLSVKVISTALNPVDWKIQAFDFFISKYPAILGTDLAGDVAEIGEGVEGFSKGDKVFFQGFFANEFAGFQQYTLVPADIVGKLPSNINYDQASTIPLAFTTAAFGLLGPAGVNLDPTLEFKPKYSGQPAVVYGGSTSVGQFAIQIFKHLGYGPIITYASARHADFLKSLGATHVVDRGQVPSSGFAEVAKKIAGAPIKIVFNSVIDGEASTISLNIVDGDGEVADVNPEAKSPGDGRKVYAIFGNSHPPNNREFGRVIWKALPKLVQDGLIVPNRVEKLPNGLAGIDGGLQKLKDNKVSGVKLVASPQETA